MSEDTEKKKEEHPQSFGSSVSPESAGSEELEKMVTASLSSDWNSSRRIPNWLIQVISAIVGALAVLLFFWVTW